MGDCCSKCNVRSITMMLGFTVFSTNLPGKLNRSSVGWGEQREPQHASHAGIVTRRIFPAVLRWGSLRSPPTYYGTTLLLTSPLFSLGLIPRRLRRSTVGWGEQREPQRAHAEQVGGITRASWVCWGSLRSPPTYARLRGFVGLHCAHRQPTRGFVGLLGFAALTANLRASAVACPRFLWQPAAGLCGSIPKPDKPEPNVGANLFARTPGHVRINSHLRKSAQKM